MRLEQLYYIVEVARQKSISKAAKNLYISQPSLSKAISQLENELDTPLFVRLQQGIIPTTTGELIIDKAQNILKEVADIKVLAENKPSLSNQNALRIEPFHCSFATNCFPRSCKSSIITIRH